MKKQGFILLFIFFSLAVQSQQVGMYSHYFFKPMVYNPAFTGNEETTNAMLLSRSQWTGFKGAPQLNLFTLDGNLVNKKVGLGMQLISDRKGISNRVGGSLNYSYRLNLNHDAQLRFGISAGIIDQTIDYSKALVEDASDPTLFTGSERKTTFDANAGLVLIWKNLEFGVSAPQLLGNNINYVDNTNVRSHYTQVRHYIGTLKYKLILSKERMISVTPEALVLYSGNAPLQYNGTLNLGWQEKIWIGATYKSNYAVDMHAGVCLYKQLYIGYAYDLILGSVSKYAGISHEIMVDFKFGKGKKEIDVPHAPEIASLIEKRLDSLQSQIDAGEDQIRQDREKIKELNEKLQQKSVQQQASAEIPHPEAGASTGTENQNVSVVSASTDKTQDSGIWIVNKKAADNKDENGKTPQMNFYVIAGTFVYKDFAEAEAARLKAKGITESGLIFYQPKQFNYVFIFKSNSKEEAIKNATSVKSLGINDAWILQLTR